MIRKIFILGIFALSFSCKEFSEKEKNNSENQQNTEVISTEENTASQEEDSSEEISALIQVKTPEEGAVINSPLQISGKAKGFWFFEADAPVKLLDENDNLIAETYIQATGDWMTQDWVNFEGNLQFEITDQKGGFLVFERANPSDLKQNDRQYKIQVNFAQ